MNNRNVKQILFGVGSSGRGRVKGEGKTEVNLVEVLYTYV
jgi:hypothetical protein